MSKTNSGLLAYAKAQVGLPYWYGTYGQTASESLYNSKKKQYPDYYTASDFPNQYGKRVHDCCGLIKGYLWSDGPTGTPKYNASQDKSASGMYSVATQKGEISSFPKKAGQLVFRGTSPSKITHVGVYDGNGYVYEAKGHAYGVVKTTFSTSQWQYWAQCLYTEDDTSTNTGTTTVVGSSNNFKIALTAGHYKYTSGKRCLKSIDPNETREWVLNDRIADKIEELLKDYTGYELLRTDDTTGETDMSLSTRTNKANNWGADFYLSIHHNAGINGGSGGGIAAYVYTSPTSESVAWQKALYDSLIAATGLKGNRANPLMKSNLHEVRETNMPAVLLELGFMDSTTDTPVVLTTTYADQCAAAIVKVLAERGGLKKKTTDPAPTTKKLYRVQVGAFSKLENAEAMLKKIKAAGFDAYIKAE